MSLNLIRGIVRPVVTLLLVLAVLAFQPFNVPVPDRLWDAFLLVLGFWFGSRQVKP